MSDEKKITLSERLQHPAKQWIKAIAWCILYILFVAWVGNFWWLVLLPLIFDAFITRYINWTWWKRSENKYFRSFMSWVDAIVFSLVAVYFINLYLFQNYQIPTSSLEKTLLVGDFLFVSKASYGPCVPNTPISMPLVQNTLPIINTKSYIEKPQWEYRRLRGFDQIEHNDIVVFNFPTGDTVPLKLLSMTTDDYYVTSYKIGRDLAIKSGANLQNIPNKNEIFQSLGRDYIKNNPDQFGEIISRPVDKCDNYVKRCIGLPGDRLQIIENQVYINGEAQEKFPYVQFNYWVQTDGTIITKNIQEELGISNQDFVSFDPNEIYSRFVESYGLEAGKTVYHLPLTQEMYQKLSAMPFIAKIALEKSDDKDVFPIGSDYGWTRDNFGPLNIPKRGQTFELSLKNLPIYEHAIRVYENNKLEVKDEKIFINDTETRYYTFKMDYYWMMGDNRHNSLDSRYWGFVPEDHVVGRPVFVWLSLDKDKGWFNGKIRWERFFRNAER
ncbi:MAG: signal peptidase I [Prevotellaceae bacterium]|nr:signal peptidase I [Prevotellaceae bacterium]